MEKLIAVTLFAWVLIGCSSTSTGITRIAPDTYLYGKQVVYGENFGSAIKAELYKEASLFCEDQAKSLELVSSNTVDRSHGQAASAEIEFKCY